MRKARQAKSNDVTHSQNYTKSESKLDEKSVEKPVKQISILDQEGQPSNVKDSSSLVFQDDANIGISKSRSPDRKQNLNFAKLAKIDKKKVVSSGKFVNPSKGGSK